MPVAVANTHRSAPAQAGSVCPPPPASPCLDWAAAASVALTALQPSVPAVGFADTRVSHVPLVAKHSVAAGHSSAACRQAAAAPSDRVSSGADCQLPATVGDVLQ